MAFEIKTTADPMFLKMGIHGEADTGKTYLAASSHFDDRLGPTLILTNEGNLEALKKLPGEVPYLEMRGEGGRWDVRVAEEVFWALAGKSEQFKDYRTVVWDTYSEGYNNQLQAEARKRAGKGVWETAESFSQYEYVQTNRKMRDLVTKFKDLDRNVIVTCHSVRDEMKRGDVVVGYQYRFAVSQGSREPLERLFPFVGYLELAKPKATPENPDPDEVRVFRSRPALRYFSKAKGDAEKVGDLQNATMTHILDKMEGK